MSPKTWMLTVYFQRYLKLDILAQLGVGYFTLIFSTGERSAAVPKRLA